MSKHKTFDLGEDLIPSVKTVEEMDSFAEDDEEPCAKFCTADNKENTIQYADANEFIPYNNRALRLKSLTGEQRERLKESIQNNGIMEPVLAMKDELNNLIILAGHNRVAIAKELGIKVPYILKKGEKADIELIVIDTNLLNRQLDDYLPSQLAYVLKAKSDAEKCKRCSCSEFGDRTTIKEIGKNYKLSKTQIFLYIKINNLIPSVMQLVDDRKISLDTAYNIAFLNKESQENLYNVIQNHDLKITLKISKELKKLEKSLSEEEILSVIGLQSVKSSVTEPRKIDYNMVKDYIPKERTDWMEYILELLKANQ